ncbi:50S ribosomal protein L35ae [Candidatus Woesearchaeota archaeon]|nr:50S ribosomal protein L35ae [Candidatus Woesearchaeota archaeon]|tara:strand:+ start:5110 stop:5367 length:258 start_codon:yes stop_codon:yes gene_type:complete
MEGAISSFRRGRHTVHTSQMIVHVKGIDKKEKAAELVGKTVVWASPAKKEIKGKITSAHGNSGALRVKFETGMPGQSLSQKVKIE